MKTISKYRWKLFLYLFVIFVVFTALIIILEYFHEKRVRINALNKELNGYTELINNYINTHSLDEKFLKSAFDSFAAILPYENIRTTVIDLEGRVLYDTKVENIEEMENHLLRPEIKEAFKNITGSWIRVSATTGEKYYYFARKYEKYYIRISVLYDLEARQVIEPDKLTLLIIVLLFFITSLTLIYLTDKFGKSTSALRKFTLKALADKPIDEDLTFPENELGIIGKDIVSIYQKQNHTRHELQSEKEKLIRHLNMLDEGIAIFSKDQSVISNNSNFIQIINLISDELVNSAENFFRIQDFSPLFNFIYGYKYTDDTDSKSNPPSFEIIINKNGKTFNARCVLFPDKSFEIIIRDTTKPAKRKLLKQQMTENIAHELKTPVSSIKGLLETVLNNKLDKAKQLDFIKRAYFQTCRLTELIDDISTLTKIEEAGSLYSLEKVNLYQIISSVLDDLQTKIKEHNISTEINVPENIEVIGNSVLLYSVFRNLIDNVINHAGENVIVRIDKYMEDLLTYYFSLTDTGIGVPEKDLPRLFERFYRVDKGRDRKSGGTGLGLSIVRNAILFHQGEISVKNRKEGGLEFLFSLSKNLEL
jgi:two-component system OmpR family sensor kinase/two-component system phosphate regulon sensor histidine kinase PhoR